MEKSVFYLLLQYLPIHIAINVLKYIPKNKDLSKPKRYYVGHDNLRVLIRQLTRKSIYQFNGEGFRSYDLSNTHNRNLRKYVYDHKVTY